ncbi:recombinase family protein [Cellulomonas sp. GbtcB1]|uniref:recombinase family protein n=1 Tax=Cellulomonas sp. GbtcB1 TaxID=2824746 RepID=UPI001C2FE6F0|nr:recombinase family protein [Cellulomonas sp. GbtcB1]
MTDRMYLRISLDTAASGSIDKQRAMLTPHARPGAVEYVDRSVSGSKTRFVERPEGGRLLNDLRSGDRLLVTKIDRAARNTEDLLGLVKRVNAVGAEVVFAEPYISTEGSMGKLLLTVFGAVAEFEAALISERRRESLAVFAGEGRHAVGKAPFGLVSVPNPHGRGLVLRPDPVSGPALREAVEDLLAGKTTQAVCAERLGIGGPTLSRLLRNNRLAGFTTSGVVDPEAAVFTLIEWDGLQRHLARPEKTWVRSQDLGAALKCGVCGDRLYFQAAKNPSHATYKCRRVRHADGEPSASVIRVNADARVEADFLGSFGSLDVLAEVSTSTSDARVRSMAEARLRLSIARAALDEAVDDVAEAEAFAGYRAAKRELMAAEALPDETTTRYVPTGETYSEVWHRSSAADRASTLLAAGVTYVVRPGRIPLEDKVRRSEQVVPQLEAAEPDYLAGQLD